MQISSLCSLSITFMQLNSSDKKAETSEKYKALDDIRKFRIVDFFSGKCDQEIGKFIDKFKAEKDMEGFRCLSYRLFAGIFSTKAVSERILSDVTNKLSANDVEAVAASVQEAFKATKQYLERDFKYAFVKELSELPLGHVNFALIEANKLAEQRDFWQNDKVFEEACKEGAEKRVRLKEVVKPYKETEKLVTITHGGGINSVLDFFSGVSMGYRLEGDSGYGLQVSVDIDSASENCVSKPLTVVDKYSEKSFRHFDKPCILTAQIAAKYLEKAPNGSEAGLKAAYIKHLKNVTIYF